MKAFTSHIPKHENTHVHKRTCDGLCVPAVRHRLVRVKMANFAFTHILLFEGAPLVGVGVRVGVRVRGRRQGGGRGCQLGSPLTAREMKGPWASGAGAPPGQSDRLTDGRCRNLEGGEKQGASRSADGVIQSPR